MYLVVDCETTGLPLRRGAPYTEVATWPRAVQIAWVSFDESGAPLNAGGGIIRPRGFTVPAAARSVHGISTLRALLAGRPLPLVLDELTRAAQLSDLVVAHNAEFDGNVIAAEYVRLGLQPPFLPRQMICTMLESTDYCRLPGPYGNKWPTLHELHMKLFGAPYAGAHDAARDAQACAACFFELRRLGVLQSLEPLSAIGNADAVCPYCESALDKMPGRKKKCPHCRNDMYVRTRPLDGQRVLVTEGDISKVEAEWNRVNRR